MRTDRNWRKWGEIDPYYAVVSHPEFRKDSLDESREQFFALGEAYVDQRLERYERHFGPVGDGTALDFGCGVGRLTLPLARHFSRVIGLDVSSAMLAEGQRNAAALDIDNVDFRASDKYLAAAQETVDFVLSFIVLQHIPVSRGMPLIDALLRRVAQGGGISLHFSVCRYDSLAKTAAYWARRHVPGTQALLNLARRRPWREPLMEMNEYPLPAILEMAQEHGFADLLVDVERHGRVLTATMTGRRTSLGTAVAD